MASGLEQSSSKNCLHLVLVSIIICCVVSTRSMPVQHHDQIKLACRARPKVVLCGQNFYPKSEGEEGLETCPSWTCSAADIAQRSAMSTILTTAHYLLCRIWRCIPAKRVHDGQVSRRPYSPLLLGKVHARLDLKYLLVSSYARLEDIWRGHVYFTVAIA